MSEHIFSSFAAWDAASVPFLQCKDGMLALITLPWKHKHTKRGWEIFLHVYSFNLEVLFQPAVYTSPRLRLFPQEIMNHENRGREWVKKKRENTGVVRMKERIKDNTNNIDNEQMKNKWAVDHEAQKTVLIALIVSFAPSRPTTVTLACHLGMIDRWAGVVLSRGSVEQHFNCPKCVFDLSCEDQKHSRESPPALGAKASTDNIEQRWVRYVKRSHTLLRTPWGSYTVLKPVTSHNLPLW